MSKLSKFKKVLTMLTCAVLTFSLISAYSNDGDKSHISAKTIAEIQEERKQNSAKIAELETQINSLENNKTEEKAYQETLSQQITIIQNNILLLDTEINQLGADIVSAEENIGTLNNNIVEQQSNVDSNIELFKERLCAMYVTGNSTLTSAVLGSGDFYDMLSRVEMVNCIAEHDENLIKNILSDIETLESSKSALETEKLNLVMKQDEQTAKKEEKKAEVADLDDKFRKSEAEVQRLALEQEKKKKSQDELDAENKQLAAQEAEIVAQIKAAEKKKAEAEAAARLKVQQEAEKKLQSNNSSNNNSSNSNTNSNSSSSADTSASASGFSWPAPGYYSISSYYGKRWGRNHNGIDIAGGGISGASACASKAGTVIAVVTSCSHNYPKSGNCCGNGYGNYVIVSHDGTYSTLYAHLSSVSVSVGDYVSQGQSVGSIGCTGGSTGYHLHFEVRKNGSAVDPSSYV